MSQLVGGLFGAPGAASNAGSYYENAMNNEINAAGSPAATDFIRLQNAALRPQFTQNEEQLAAYNAAQGLTGSGSGAANFSNLGASEAGTIAGADAPLYAQALSQYGQINAAMPGAQEAAYQQAVDQGYQALGTAASFFGLGMGGGGGASPAGVGGSGYYDSGGNWVSSIGAPPVSPAYASTEDTTSQTPYYTNADTTTQYTGTPY